LIYKPALHLNTIKRHHAIIPPEVEKEIVFDKMVHRLGNILASTGGKVTVYATALTIAAIGDRLNRASDIKYVTYDDWSNLSKILSPIDKGDNIWMVASRRDGISYNRQMPYALSWLNRHASGRSIMLYYPAQALDEGSRYLT
ncbi:MAG: cation:proton antiporter, partial [Rikenellaceae bacterium]|nr:cation:proton antiporter [Rikenellaceae bacterium]